MALGKGQGPIRTQTPTPSFSHPDPPRFRQRLASHARSGISLHRGSAPGLEFARGHRAKYPLERLFRPQVVLNAPCR